MPRTDVYVTNGGYGGVQYALRYGVPIVATGGKEDKPEVGARVAWSGVGRRLRTERPSPRALRRDILAVLEQPRYREASRRIAAEMAAAPGFAGLADVVDKLAGTTPASTQYVRGLSLSLKISSESARTDLQDYRLGDDAAQCERLRRRRDGR